MSLLAQLHYTVLLQLYKVLFLIINERIMNKQMRVWANTNIRQKRSLCNPSHVYITRKYQM